MPFRVEGGGGGEEGANSISFILKMKCLFRFTGLTELIYTFHLSFSIKLSGFLFLFVARYHCASLEFNANPLPGITDMVTQM